MSLSGYLALADLVPLQELGFHVALGSSPHSCASSVWVMWSRLSNSGTALRLSFTGAQGTGGLHIACSISSGCAAFAVLDSLSPAGEEANTARCVGLFRPSLCVGFFVAHKELGR